MRHHIVRRKISWSWNPRPIASMKGVPQGINVENDGEHLPAAIINLRHEITFKELDSMIIFENPRCKAIMLTSVEYEGSTERTTAGSCLPWIERWASLNEQPWRTHHMLIADQEVVDNRLLLKFWWTYLLSIGDISYGLQIWPQKLVYCKFRLYDSGSS